MPGGEVVANQSLTNKPTIRQNGVFEEKRGSSNAIDARVRLSRRYRCFGLIQLIQSSMGKEIAPGLIRFRVYPFADNAGQSSVHFFIRQHSCHAEGVSEVLDL